ncbi:MAG TPA: hypothetical protein VFV67_05100 [Actinophytocola sp.]|uniref:hypothetical protein n=1 Tax=Actinophytocola sp. TaxID=1872138 RepID=UPI002DBBF2DA|nr:hypothetical protein [Actinophytocola sp.]HEU5470009.1 hypothetical protein [Actinophytocola sp.]
MPPDEHGLLSIRAWLVAPWLFAVAVLGVTGFGGVLLAADWQVTPSAVVAGPAAAGTAVLATAVDWRGRRLRWVARLGYPLLVCAAGVALTDLTVPAPVAMLAGSPAVIALGILIARERDKVIPIA